MACSRVNFTSTFFLNVLLYMEYYSIMYKGLVYANGNMVQNACIWKWDKYF